MLQAESAHQDALRTLQEKYSKKIEEYEVKIFNPTFRKNASKAPKINLQNFDRALQSKKNEMTLLV